MSPKKPRITVAEWPAIVAAAVELASRCEARAAPARIAGAQSGKPDGRRGLLDLLHSLFVRPLTEAIELPDEQELQIIQLWKVVRDTTLPFDRLLQTELVSMVKRFGWMGGNETTAGSDPAEAKQTEGTDRNKKGRRGRPNAFDPAKDKKLFADWKASGLTAKEFARNRGIKYADAEAGIKRHRERHRRESAS